MRCGKTKLYFGSVFYSKKYIRKHKWKLKKKGIVPQAEQSWSHGTFLEPRILLELKAIFDRFDQYGAGDGQSKVECMPSAMRQPRHFDSVLSIAMSMQNEIL